MMNLLPAPKMIRPLPGSCENPREVSRRLEPLARAHPEAYSLAITREGISLRANAEPGLFYAAQTLAQIRQQSPGGLPCVEIEDWPDYDARGFYHDVSRGCVPTLASLLALAETCARYKLNQLQLYIEHTYAFRNHPEVWRGADPLTAEEIRALDARCAELHIDLVPSFSTFGHFYPWIHRKFPHLNELERDVSGDPFTWWDRMMHYTLDCSDPRSLDLVREIITEVRPLFRSRYFNICCDETFDLGKGKNRRRAETEGSHALYLGFLNQICGIVREHNAIPMFWDEVARHYPDHIGQLPGEGVSLSWNYELDGERMRREAACLRDGGRQFYMCAGTSSWSPGFIGHYRRAVDNARLNAATGLDCGACGFLNTNWGDNGHPSPFSTALPGLMAGASFSWNFAGTNTSDADSLLADISRHLYRDAEGTLLPLLAGAAEKSAASWQMLVWSRMPRAFGLPADWFDARTHLPNGLFTRPPEDHEQALRELVGIREQVTRAMETCTPPDPGSNEAQAVDGVGNPGEHRLNLEEALLGLDGRILLEKTTLLLARLAGRVNSVTPDAETTARELRAFARRFEKNWRARSKESELSLIVQTIEGVADAITGRAPLALCIPIEADACAG